jgi:hypothetical protein
VAPFLEDKPLRHRAVALRLLEGETVKRLTRPSLLSSVHGRILEVLLTIPSWVLRYQRQPEIRPWADGFRSVLARLPEDVRFLILTHQEGLSPLTAWLEELDLTGRSEVLAVPDKTRFGTWPQDGFVVCTDGRDGARTLAQPLSYRTVEDAYLPGMVSVATRAPLAHPPLPFQGGNLLVGDDFWLLGMDSAVEAVHLGLVEDGPDRELRAGVEEVFGRYLDGSRKLHLVGSRLPVPGFENHASSRRLTVRGEVWTEISYRGNSRGTTQPIFHIDAFLTLAGRDDGGRPVVLVGDPALASELTGQPPRPETMVPIFTDIAHQLETIGFRVVRNPLPLVHHDDGAARTRSWYFATSNNATVEVSEGGKRVWLPTYGSEAHPELEATDEANRKIWEGLGFRVTQLGDFHPFARELGAAHCLIKCLARE